jgi:UDP-N-acetylmuramoyl-L-alanyl-D-glutamate--2,6-diaminopimelate ligase
VIAEEASVIRQVRFDPASVRKLGIRRLELDSRRLRPGDTFVALPGEARDGRNFIAAAISAGASSVIWESEGYTWDRTRTLPNLGVPRLRENLGAIASHVLGNPSSKLEVIGVTGTNGKTSCTHWIAASLSQLGKKCAVIGTLGSGFPAALETTENTTPDAISLHSAIAGFVETGAQAVAMEVSSHSLVQGRVNAIEFDIAVLTNLTQDHLDYHGTIEKYRAAKALLFDCATLASAVLNADDAFGAELLRNLPRPGLEVVGYGFDSDSCAVRGRNLRHDVAGTEFEVHTPWGRGEIASALPGRFNAYNLLAALCVLCLSDIKLDSAIAVLRSVTPVRGRMQTIGGDGAPLVVVDYAHTPDALQNVLSTLRGIAKRELVCVFGCGGDRDRAKRPLMGEIATRLADRVIVTSDNPRSEDPLAIIADITAGTSRTPNVIPDRAAAIGAAIADAAKDDVVLVAGKGHETYQEMRGIRIPFDDCEVAKHALEAWRNRHAALE